jgi:hypothetical protein
LHFRGQTKDSANGSAKSIMNPRSRFLSLFKPFQMLGKLCSSMAELLVMIAISLRIHPGNHRSAAEPNGFGT